MIVVVRRDYIYVAFDSRDYIPLFGISEMVKAYIKRCSNMLVSLSRFSAVGAKDLSDGIPYT